MADHQSNRDEFRCRGDVFKIKTAKARRTPLGKSEAADFRGFSRIEGLE
jgi:hypothetical protein